MSDTTQHISSRQIELFFRARLQNKKPKLSSTMIAFAFSSVVDFLLHHLNNDEASK